MPPKLQFTPKTIGALVAIAVLVVVLWVRASKSSDGPVDRPVELGKEINVKINPNANVGASYRAQSDDSIDREMLFRQALKEAKFIFTAPSDGTYTATLKNANLQDAYDVDLFGYEFDKVPVPSPNFKTANYVNTVGNFLNSRKYGQSSNEFGNFSLEKDQKVAIIAFPWWVKSRPTNLSLLIEKL